MRLAAWPALYFRIVPQVVPPTSLCAMPRYFMPNLMLVSGLNSPLVRAGVAHHAGGRRLDLHQADLAGPAARVRPVVALDADDGMRQRHRHAIGCRIARNQRGVAGGTRDASRRPRALSRPFTLLRAIALRLGRTRRSTPSSLSIADLRLALRLAGLDRPWLRPVLACALLRIERFALAGFMAFVGIHAFASLGLAAIRSSSCQAAIASLLPAMSLRRLCRLRSRRNLRNRLVEHVPVGFRLRLGDKSHHAGSQCCRSNGQSFHVGPVLYRRAERISGAFDIEMREHRKDGRRFERRAICRAN